MSEAILRLRSMIVTYVGPTVLYVHTDQAPTDDEWDASLEFYKRAPDFENHRVLVSTAGGAPSAAQRARLKVAMNGRRVRVGLLTTSALVRAAGTAIGWFNPEYRVYAPTDLELALDHLRVSSADRIHLRQKLGELRAELGLRTDSEAPPQPRQMAR